LKKSVLGRRSDCEFRRAEAEETARELAKQELVLSYEAVVAMLSRFPQVHFVFPHSSFFLKKQKLFLSMMIILKMPLVIFSSIFN